MVDIYQIPAFVMVTILLVAFGYLYRRSATTRNLLWLVGWCIADLHACIDALNLHSTAWTLVSNVSMLIAASFFVGSLSPEKLLDKPPLLYVTSMFPLLLTFAIMSSLIPHPHRGTIYVAYALGIIVIGLSIRWSVVDGILPLPISGLILLLGAVCYWAYITTGNFPSALLILHAGMNIFTLLLVLFLFRRASPGTIFTAVGLLGWSFGPIRNFHHLPISFMHALAVGKIVSMSQVIAAIGMILLVLEDETESNLRTKESDRRVRREMEAYSHIEIRPRHQSDYALLFRNVCSSIVENSGFQEAYLLLQNNAGYYNVVASAGEVDKTRSAMEAFAQNLDPDRLISHPSDTVNSSGPQSEPGEFTPLPLYVDEERALGERTLFAIAPTTSTGRSDCALILTCRKYPDTPIKADDLLPARLLLARIQSARDYTLMTQKLIYSEKMAVVGQLAGGVAHQLNNPLTVVMGYASLLSDTIDDPQQRKRAESIHNESRRMRDIIESLARFARPTPQEFSPTSVDELLHDIERLQRTDMIRRAIDLRLSIADNLPPVLASANQIRQALLQVIKNSIEALERNAPSQERTIRIDASAQQDVVQIMVSDSGPGFPNPDRAFDPFFTTKGPGNGNGLGLSLCYAIVREHQGDISALNLHPHGAAIFIELPIAKNE